MYRRDKWWWGVKIKKNNKQNKNIYQAPTHAKELGPSRKTGCLKDIVHAGKGVGEVVADGTGQ